MKTVAILLVCWAAVVLGGPLKSNYKLAPNTPENIALIASGAHKQTVEELSGQFEGDIVLTDRQREAINSHARNGLVDTTYRWHTKELAYNFTTSLDDNFRAEVLRALRTIEAAAPCLKFVQRTTELDYVQVYVSELQSIYILSADEQF